MGKFVVREVPSGIKFDLKASNGEIIATSEVYKTKVSCLNGVKSVAKNAPVANVEDNKVVVNVGSVDHPMVDEHFIEWVYVQTENGGQRKTLKPGDAPNVSFCLGDDQAVAVYAYCNLHGLWMTEV